MSTNLELKQFSVGTFDNNVYIVVDPNTKDSVLFDAPTDAQKILSTLAGANLKAIIMTHTDADHVQALKEVKEATEAPIGVHPEDASRLPVREDFEIRDGETLQLGSITLTALHTPGHTPGSLCFLAGDILIAGDTLFPGGPGNTHDSKERFNEIIGHIGSKLFVLPDDTKVYPGHGKATSIGAEKPHLQEWVQRGW
ncbi:MAG: MBL fold metallo-hydrolase [Chloroflexota bacterium]